MILVLVDYADCAGFGCVCGGDLLCWWFAIWCGLRFVGGLIVVVGCCLLVWVWGGWFDLSWYLWFACLLVSVRVSWFYGLVRLVLGVVCCWFAFVLLVLFVAAWVCGAV